MASAPFAYEDDLSELVQQVARDLKNAGVDPDLLDLVNLATLARILENRDEELGSYLNDGLTASGYHVSATSGTVCVSSTPTAVVWETEELASSADASWEASPNPTRVTFAAEGLWLVTVGLGWAATATGARHLGVRKNGSGNLTGATAPASTVVTPLNNATFHLETAAGDYLEAIATQDSGTDKTATGFLHAAYLGAT
jgi:hypothetical protein